MQVFKDQADWRHVFGSNSSHFQTKSAHPFARKSIHTEQTISSDGKIRHGLRALLQEFCTDTTIHGLRNIESGRSLLERLWWIVVVALSVCCCALLIQQVYHKWDSNPVIVSLDDTPTKIWDIPFPAITVCPEAKINSLVMNFTDDFNTYFHSKDTLDQKREDQLMAALQICDDYFYVVRQYQQKFTNRSSHVVSVLRNLSVNGKSTVIWCKKGRELCKKYFYQTLTEEGICFTFNGFSQRDMFNKGVLHGEYKYLTETKRAVNWSLESGYAAETPFQTHPFRASGYALRLKLNLVSYKRDIEAHCSEEQGFRVVLHSPDEYPLPYAKHLLLSLDRHVNIAIRPQIMTTAKELVNYAPVRRQCYFNHERRLKFFRVYNQNNCELECLTNYTLSRCACVKFSMPRSAGTRVCSTVEQRCLIDARYSILEMMSQNSVTNNGLLSACSCMPACNSIEYLTEITHSSYDHIQSANSRLLQMTLGLSLQKVMESYKSSKVSIYFKGAEFVSSRRGELFGMTDFVANCGGILGLCLGVSFVSLVELLYYCVARPLMVVRALADQRRIIAVQGHVAERY